MGRIALVTICLLAPWLPAWAQDVADPAGDRAKRIERLITHLDSDDEDVRAGAAVALGNTGSKAAVPPLIMALSDEDENVRLFVGQSLGIVGPKAAAAISALATVLANEGENEQVRNVMAKALADIGGAPAAPPLIAALSSESKSVRGTARNQLRNLGWSLKTKGTVLWWVVPRAFWKEALGLLLFLSCWYWRYPLHRPAGRLRRIAFFATLAGAPAGVACGSVYYAITLEWAQGFLPDTLTLVPFPVAAVLSTALVCALAAIGSCQRKPPEAVPHGDSGLNPGVSG